jgi:hypothetical protein
MGEAAAYVERPLRQPRLPARRWPAGGDGRPRRWPPAGLRRGLRVGRRPRPPPGCYQHRGAGHGGVALTRAADSSAVGLTGAAGAGGVLATPSEHEPCALAFRLRPTSRRQWPAGCGRRLIRPRRPSLGGPSPVLAMTHAAVHHSHLAPRALLSRPKALRLAPAVRRLSSMTQSATAGQRCQSCRPSAATRLLAASASGLVFECGPMA